MNTPAHLLLGGALMGKSGQRRLIWAGIAGGLAPDLSLYVLAGVSLTILQIAPSRVFNELYFSDLWQSIFAVDNSFFVWGLLLGLAIWRRSNWAMAFAGAGLLHIALDFPLHHDDGRAHFWPVTSWVFESPVSYWDRSHGAGWVAPIEGAFALAAAAFILWRRPGWLLGLTALILIAAQLRTGYMWMFVFAM